MAGQTFTLADVILAAMDERLAGVFTAMPGQIQSYNATEQSVDVQPLLLHGYTNQDGDRATEKLPVIPRVPVVFPGGGGFRLTFPLAVGDTCLLVFSNSSLDRWLVTGGVVDPADDKRHHLQDAVAIVGLKDYPHALKSAPTSTMSLGSDTGVTIEISPTQVLLGGPDATDPVVRKSDLDNFIQNDYNNHSHHPPNLSSGTYAVGTDATHTTDSPSSASTPACSSTVLTK